MKSFVTSFFIVTIASSAHLSATPFDGTYAVTASDCADDTAMRFVLNDNVAEWGAETDCLLSNPVNIRDMPNARLYDAHCVGEGQVRDRRLLLVGDTMVFAGDEHADVQLHVITESIVWHYVRCSAVAE